jgi:hypothetical protein
MVHSALAGIRLIFRLALALILVAGLALSAFVAFRGSQPMQVQGAESMTYWQFVRERISAIRELPTRCQRMHFTGYAIAVPLYPLLYTYVGLNPDGLIARHTQPHPLIPEDVHWGDAPGVWWSLVEQVSWEAWVTPHLPTVMPECNLKFPEGISVEN